MKASLPMIVLGLILAASAQSVMADNETATPTASTNRDANYYVAAGKTYNMHAFDHARMLGKYAKAGNGPVPAAVVKEHTSAIRQNVEKAKKSFAQLAEKAKSNPAMAKQLAEIQQRLANVTSQVSQLESDKDAEAKMLVSSTNAISEDLTATHQASKEIDSVIDDQLQSSGDTSQFDNPESSSYFFTGEGHFLD